MPSDLKHAELVARRQAFGRHFEPTENDRLLAEALLDGQLKLAPHPNVGLTDPITWDIDPFGQRNWIAQFHMLRWIDPMRRLAAAGDRSFMPAWEKIARSWIEAHPTESYRRGVGYAWADMVDAMRTQTLLFGIPYVDDPSWLIQALTVHGEWLAQEAHLGHSNHALHQHTALLLVGNALGREDWTQLAQERIQVHVREAFDDEGVNAEAAPGYWMLNYQWTNDLVRRYELEGMNSSSIVDRISRTPESLAHAARPDGTLEVIGDTGPNAHLRGMPDERLLYIATEGADGRPPEATNALYHSGFAFGRSGWGETERRLRDETFYSLRFGSAKAVHGHHDGGSLTYWAQGIPVLVDSGKYSYVKGEFRDYVLGRRGHNVPHVVEGVYDPAVQVELAAYSSTDSHIYYRLRDDGYDGVSIERQVVYSRLTESLLVIDTVSADREVEVETRWHVDPLSSVRVESGRAIVNRNSRTTALVWGGSTPRIEVAKGRSAPLDGWTSPGWGKQVPTSVVKATRRGRRFRIVMGVFPGDSGEERLKVTSLGAGSSEFDVRGYQRHEQILIRGDSVAGRSAGVSRHVLSSTQSAKNLDAGAVEALEIEYGAVRSRLAQGLSIEPGALAVINDRLRAGVDYGGAALLLDATGTSDDEGPVAVDSRTRAALRPVQIADTSHQSVRGARVSFYGGVPRALDLRAPRSVHVMNIGPLALPVRIHRADSPYLVVVLHGALNRLKSELPRFERMRSLGDLGVNVMAFADPTLDLDPTLSLGWYLGTRSIDLPPVLAEVVDRFVQQQGIERVVLLGNSGGGFAALATALDIPASTAIVMSPQTDIRRYHEAYSARALTTVFGTPVMRRQDEVRVSLIERYRNSRGCPNIDYYINSGDTHHVREHAEPFWDAIKEVRPEIRLSVERLELGNGHNSPSSDSVMDFVRSAIGMKVARPNS